MMQSPRRTKTQPGTSRMRANPMASTHHTAVVWASGTARTNRGRRKSAAVTCASTGAPSVAGIELRQHGCAAGGGILLDARVERAAMGIHRHHERTEMPDAEAPQAFGMEIVEVDVLDGLDPGGLQRGSAADHGEIGAAEVAERLQA